MIKIYNETFAKKFNLSEILSKDRRFRSLKLNRIWKQVNKINKIAVELLKRNLNVTYQVSDKHIPLFQIQF